MAAGWEGRTTHSGKRARHRPTPKAVGVSTTECLRYNFGRMRFFRGQIVPLAYVNAAAISYRMTADQVVQLLDYIDSCGGRVVRSCGKCQRCTFWCNEPPVEIN